MAGKNRRTFATTIDSEISQDFKIACVTRKQNMNEILEKLMVMYIKGEIEIENE
mgnify:CR=1 FL=1